MLTRSCVSGAACPSFRADDAKGRLDRRRISAHQHDGRARSLGADGLDGLEEHGGIARVVLDDDADLERLRRTIHHASAGIEQFLGIIEKLRQTTPSPPSSLPN